MNQRLQLEYQMLEMQSREKFLRGEIVVDTTWGTPIWGVTMQIDLNETVKSHIGTCQDSLRTLESESFHMMPRECLHISFDQVVFWNGSYAKGSQQTWQGIAEDFTTAFRKQDHVHAAFPICFSKLIATTSSIIWCAHDESDELQKMRDAFHAALPFPSETAKSNRIIHTTIARYQHPPRDPQRVLNFLESQTEKVPMQVDQIILRNELVFPSLSTHDLATVRLI